MDNMLIITGSLAYDHIMNFPGKFTEHILPEKIHTLNVSFLVDTFARRRGGTAGNVSYSLGLLKTDHTLFSIIGKDYQEYKRAFKKIGIDFSHVLIDPSSYTANGFAITDNTENQIWGYFFGTAENMHTLQISRIASSGDFVLVGPSGAKGTMSFVSQCVENAIPFMFDPGFTLTQITDEDLTYGVDTTTILIGNEYEQSLMKRRVKHFDKRTKSKIIITTLGDKGASIETQGKSIVIKPASVTNAADPTGAGDAWRSGFLAGYIKGYDLKTCGQMGAIASAYCVEHYGTQEHTYTKRQFQNRYRQTYGSLVEL